MVPGGLEICDEAQYWKTLVLLKHPLTTKTVSATFAVSSTRLTQHPLQSTALYNGDSPPKLANNISFFFLLLLLLLFFLSYLTALKHAVRQLLISLLFSHLSMCKVLRAKVFAEVFIFFLNWYYYKFGHVTANLSFLTAIFCQWQ